MSTADFIDGLKLLSRCRMCAGKRYVCAIDGYGMSFQCSKMDDKMVSKGNKTHHGAWEISRALLHGLLRDVVDNKPEWGELAP